MYPKEGTYIKRKLPEAKGKGYIIFKIETYYDTGSYSNCWRWAWGKIVVNTYDEEDIKMYVYEQGESYAMPVYDFQSMNKQKKKYRDELMDSGECFAEVL